MIKKKILIFGGSGLLGSHCYNYFVKNYDVRWTFSNPIKKDKNSIRYVYDKNISKLENIIKDFKPDIVINSLGLVSVDDCEKNHELAYNLNTKFVSNIVELLQKYRMCNTYLIQISSGGVYGNRVNNKDMPWEETSDLNPLSIYAKSKVDGEYEALKFEGPSLIIRSDFYGLNKIRNNRTLLSWIIHDAKKNIQMKGWENIFFSPISAYKLCKTVEDLFKGNNTGIFNISSETGCNKFEFVENVCNILGLNPDLKKNTVKSVIRPRYSVLSCKKLKNTINFECNWKTDLKSYLKYNYFEDLKIV